METKLTGLKRQKVFLDNKISNKTDSFFITDKVMESMRDSGYRDIRKAINDLIDNSEQANAQKIAVITTSGRENKKGAREKITNIAVIDDGHGMYPEMLTEAIKWGGTDRHNERDGLGRFGFGLPTASISVTRTYDVYSKVKGKDWYKVSFDLDVITKQVMSNGGNIAFTPKYEKAELPNFIKDQIKLLWKKSDLEQGTIVLLKNPDRIRSFSLPQTFETKMIHNIGLTYRHFIPRVSFYVNDKKVEMIDPLFLNPNCIGYEDENGHKAEGLESLSFNIKNKFFEDKGALGNITLNFSHMHPKFYINKEGKRITNRFKTLKENNGYFIICRAGRQIDIVRDPGYQREEDNITMVNYDRNWVVELNFDPVLDELFGITTNKQQVEIDGYLWDYFKEKGIPEIISGLRKKGKELRTKEEIINEENKDENRDSEIIMAEAEKFDRSKITEEKKDKAKKRIKAKAKKIAETQNKDEEEVYKDLEEEANKKMYKVEFTDLPGSLFYEAVQWGPQTIIKINSAHRFYSDIYSIQDPRGKTALELLLFVLGKCELEATSHEMETFYLNEKYAWSQKLDIRLKMLDNQDPIIDKKSSEEKD